MIYRIFLRKQTEVRTKNRAIPTFSAFSPSAFVPSHFTFLFFFFRVFGLLFWLLPGWRWTNAGGFRKWIFAKLNLVEWKSTVQRKTPEAAPPLRNRSQFQNKEGPTGQRREQSMPVPGRKMDFLRSVFPKSALAVLQQPTTRRDWNIHLLIIPQLGFQERVIVASQCQSSTIPRFVMAIS